MNTSQPRPNGNGRFRRNHRRAGATLVVFVLFLALTGMDVDGLRTAAGETGTLIAVMDFIMFDDTLVGRFAEFASLDPDVAGQIRFALAGPEVDPV